MLRTCLSLDFAMMPEELSAPIVFAPDLGSLQLA